MRRSGSRSLIRRLRMKRVMLPSSDGP
jgi:hypothetical protein